MLIDGCPDAFPEVAVLFCFWMLLQPDIQICQRHPAACALKRHADQVVPGQGGQVRVRHGEGAVLREMEGHQQGVLLMQQEQVFRHDGDEGLLVPALVGDAVELPLDQEGFKIPHPHHVVLYGIEPSLHPDVAYKHGHAAIFPERHVELADAEVQLLQEVIVVLAPGQVIRVGLPPHVPGILDDVVVWWMEEHQVRRVLHVVLQCVPPALPVGRCGVQVIEDGPYAAPVCGSLAGAGSELLVKWVLPKTSGRKAGVQVVLIK